ncbi:cellulose binding domain-containing protein [Sphaerisporangium perillae]|uniref:cellulose binding domain-containing protein n=1 Tax=Sphaerisporangium perillae TaxID=2935860 RepID=UPI00200EAA59|nr:cellulose binding domain-containing protein [Sphaerisporangium perillae]
MACAATYKITSSWSGSFQADVAVRNSGSTAIKGWTVAWAFPDGQTITQIWNGTHTQTGANVSVKNVSWNGGLAAGGSASFGFIATLNGANGVPASVTCTPA